MELMKFEYCKGTTYCPKCGKDADCPECCAKMDYCPHFGETIEKHDCFIIFTTDKYHGCDRMSNYTATLIIDGEDYASAHVETDESDAGTDVIHMQLFSISEEKQIEHLAWEFTSKEM